MKLTVKENSKNYLCAVVEVKELFPIEGADRIVRTVIFGNNVIVSKDVKIGDKMLYFVSGTKLNPDFCKWNDLLTDADQNRNKKVGYISYKQFRVKAIKLKGVISDGMLLPVNSLGFNDEAYDSDLKVGDEFTDIDDISICEKYIIPSNQRGGGNGTPRQKSAKISRLVENQFYFHNDTDNFRKNAHKVNPNDIIGVHYKKHGTSVVIGNVLVKKTLSWYEKLLQKLGINIVNIEYDIIYSSRKVVKNGFLETPNAKSYYKTDIWGDVKEEIKDKIPKNFTIYGEILGYTSDGAFIQHSYDYGCDYKTHKFYVYRITCVNPDGKTIELTDKQIEEFCEKHGLLYKDTFIFYGKARDLFNKLNLKHKFWLSPDLDNSRDWQENFTKLLEMEYNEKDCYICKTKVPEEGIVIRKEALDHYEAYKLKSRRFLLQESDLQEKEMTNLEDNQETEENNESTD